MLSATYIDIPYTLGAGHVDECIFNTLGSDKQYSIALGIRNTITVAMASIASAVYNYVSGILSPRYCPPLVKMPMDADHPEYTKSFTVDQVEEYKKVDNLLY